VGDFGHEFILALVAVMSGAWLMMLLVVEGHVRMAVPDSLT